VYQDITRQQDVLGEQLAVDRGRLHVEHLNTVCIFVVVGSQRTRCISSFDDISDKCQIRVNQIAKAIFLFRTRTFHLTLTIFSCIL